MDRIPVSSSNVSSIGYDTGTGTMEVEFIGGSIYHYFEVPVDVYQSVLSASSVGKALNQSVKGIYRFQQVV